jgi:hypothetical protein
MKRVNALRSGSRAGSACGTNSRLARGQGGLGFRRRRPKSLLARARRDTWHRKACTNSALKAMLASSQGGPWFSGAIRSTSLCERYLRNKSLLARARADYGSGRRQPTPPLRSNRAPHVVPERRQPSSRLASSWRALGFPVKRHQGRCLRERARSWFPPRLKPRFATVSLSQGTRTSRARIIGRVGAADTRMEFFHLTFASEGRMPCSPPVAAMRGAWHAARLASARGKLRPLLHRR